MPAHGASHGFHGNNAPKSPSGAKHSAFEFRTTEHARRLQACRRPSHGPCSSSPRRRAPGCSPVRQLRVTKPNECVRAPEGGRHSVLLRTASSKLKRLGADRMARPGFAPPSAHAIVVPPKYILASSYHGLHNRCTTSVHRRYTRATKSLRLRGAKRGPHDVSARALAALARAHARITKHVCAAVVHVGQKRGESGPRPILFRRPRSYKSFEGPSNRAWPQRARQVSPVRNRTARLYL